MSETIWHFPVSPQQGWQALEVPLGARFIHLGTNREGLRAWAVVDPDAEMVTVRVAVVGTGWGVPENARHVSTEIGATGYVWHLFVQEGYPR